MKLGPSFSDIVIGSGPTAYATVTALVGVKRHPLIVDFGADPRFTNCRLERVSSVASKSGGLRARVFDYPRSLITSKDGNHLPISSARGGLSNVWGAGILVRRASESSGFAPVWPGMENAYTSLLGLIPHVGSNDQTSVRFPWQSNGQTAPQSKRYFEVVKKLQGVSSDVLIGWPRIALNNGLGQCIRCGSCLHGCPKDLFFNARIELEVLALGGFCSFADGPALRIKSDGAGVTVELPSRVIHGNRVFLAAGPVGTPALLQRSSLIGDEIVVKDSAVFYCGFFNQNRANGDESEFTSSHLVAFANKSGEDDFQLAIYESNDEYLSRLGAVIRLPTKGLKAPKFITNRINAGIGFLDSSVSGSLSLRYQNGKTIVTRNQPHGLSERAKRIVNRVSRITRQFGVYAIPNFVLVPPAGSGYHSGSSMPIGGELVDYSGSLSGNSNIFIVDATSLPEINAGSHTFTAMANAFRIAKEAK